MLGVETEGGGRGHGHGHGGVPSSSSAAENFDAGQYAFFGKESLEGLDLGCLEDSGGDGNGGGFSGHEEGLHRLSSVGEEVDNMSNLSDIDDLASTFAKLNRSISGTRNPGVIGDRRSILRGSSLTVDWTEDVEFPNWVDQDIFENEEFQESKRWWSSHSSVQQGDSKPLSRTSSYPQQPLQHHASEPIVLPKTSSFTSFPPPAGGRSPYPAQGLTRHGSIPSIGTGLQMGSPSMSLPGSPYHMTGPSHGPPYGGCMPYGALNLPVSNPMQNDWSNQANPFTGEHLNLLPNLLHKQLSLPNSPISSLLFSQQQQRLAQVQPSHQNYLNLPPHLFYPHHSQELVRFDSVGSIPSSRDKRSRLGRGKHNNRFSQQQSDTGSQNGGNGGLKFRSKYMSSEEIESILRMQHSASHNSDPYVVDYYHQACMVKRGATSSRQKTNFAPTSMKDLPSKSRSSSDQHTYLQVDALGRVSFSSIRRPQSLVEVDHPSSADGSHDPKSIMRPLEKEPMLAARVTVEDALCLLLEVDDIDRLLQSSQTQDNNFQLKRRRQVLLEGLAASLQLVDPLGPSKSGGQSSGLAAKDDIVFLRIVSLPKGRKFLARYLRLLVPGSELTRIVCMTIFRHLRFLFGGLPSDSSAAETTVALAKTVSSCVHHMELGALSACLAAIVCSSEQPPLRPLGSSAGDGASLIIKAVLDRATELLTDHRSAANYTVPNRTLWQTSFDAFFGLLTKYCLSKFESILQMFVMQTPSSVMGPEAAKATSKEMPVELLRASLPHTNEQQRQMLLDFAQRSTPVTGFNPPSASGDTSLQNLFLVDKYSTQGQRGQYTFRY